VEKNAEGLEASFLLLLLLLRPDALNAFAV